MLVAVIVLVVRWRRTARSAQGPNMVTRGEDAERTLAAAPARPQAAPLPPIAAADNPWGVPLIDVRPVTRGTLSFSTDQQHARNAISFGQEDGTSFWNAPVPAAPALPIGLRFTIEPPFSDGTLAMLCRR